MEFFLTLVGYIASLCAAMIVLAAAVAYVVPDLPPHRPATELSAQKGEPLGGRALTRRLAARAIRGPD
jgi:hypothetical protein